MDRPETVGRLTEILRDGGYLADRGLSTALFVALSLDRPILLEGEVGVGKTEVAKVLASVFGRKLIRLQCYEGIDTNQALYEWDYARQMLQIRALSERHVEDDAAVDKLFGPKFLLERPLLEAVRAGDRAVLLIDEVDRADDEFEAFLLEVLSDFQITHPRDRHDHRRERTARRAHLQPHPRAARRAQASLPLPLGGLPQRRARGRDRAGPGAGGVAGAGPEGRRRRQPAARPSTWPSRPGSPRRSTGSARSDVLGETELDARTVDDTLGAVVKERDDLDLVRDSLEEIASGA